MNTNDPAGFWIRFGALVLDAIIVGVPLAIIAHALGVKYVTDIISFLYTLLTPVLWNGYTIGKRICGIRIVKISDGLPPSLGTMLLRHIVAGLIYGFTLGIALIVSATMVAAREDKRSIHDFIAGTEVVHERL
ncbi:RDD family protein [Paenibacillus sp. PR3]|uniref:RDD family protein n=1 Tax=Paenibacillus terricola TaxID=2763503 RepID=A0ABR8MVG3_9BACL|nr:RDD family protein [Paenibacillus terricola]MBD3919056.1 RDD family protein [Paenibacillus terricola]